jgi:replicative DNA helicase
VLAARVDQHKFRAGFLNQDERRKLQFALADLTEAPLFLDDTPGVNLMDVHAKLRRMQSEHGLSLVVIDYLQLMSSRGRIENRNQEVSAISRGLKLMAKDLNVPFLVLSQLSRASETRRGRSQAAVERSARFRIDRAGRRSGGVHFREEVYKRDREDVKGLADLIIAKQRNGPIGTCRCDSSGNTRASKIEWTTCRKSRWGRLVRLRHRVLCYLNSIPFKSVSAA